MWKRFYKMGEVVFLGYHLNCQKRIPRLSMSQTARVAWTARHAQTQGSFLSEDAVVLLPGEKATLFDAPGNGFLQSFYLVIPVQMADCRFRIFTAGRDSADLDQAVESFFLSGPEGKSVFSDRVGKTVSENGEEAAYYRTLCVPFENGCRIEIENTGAGQMKASLSVQYAKMEQAPHFGRFTRVLGTEKHGHARFSGEEIVVLHQKGKGALSSIQFSANNLTSACYLEGNVEIYIDGNRFPEYQSSGTEEFFMGGIYFTNLHDNTYSGCTYTFNDGSGEKKDYGVSAHRIFEKDAITFDSELKIVWHNGQPNQGPVCGPTEYTFAFVYSLDEQPGAADDALPAEEACRLISTEDSCRYERKLYSVRGSAVQEANGDQVIAELQEAGSVELIHLCFDSPQSAESTLLAVETDGELSDWIPVPLFFCTPEGYEGSEIFSSAGKTGAASYYRYMDFSFQRSFKLHLSSGEKNSEVTWYLEYREGLPVPFYRRQLKLLSSGEDRKAVLLAEGKGAVDEVIFCGDRLSDNVLEWTQSDTKPLATFRVPSMVRSHGDFYTQGTSQESGVIHAGKNVLAYRAFGKERFCFEHGLRVRFHMKESTEFRMLLFYRVQEEEGNVSAKNLSARLNRLDMAGGTYEMRCYNPIEAPDGAIEAGETRVMLEDFGAGCLRGIRLGTPPYGPALHEARMRIYLNGEKEPAVDTTCERFFSASYEDPIFWSHTADLCRLSKRGAQNPKNEGQHSGFFRYLDMPYQDGILVTLTAPDDCKVDGFDNLYYASARESAQSFGKLDQTKMVSTVSTVPAGKSVTLPLWDGPAAVTSIQLQTSGETSPDAVFRIQEGDRVLMDAALWQYFLGAPSGEAVPVIGNYSDSWREEIGREEGYYSAPLQGWIRKGRTSPFRNVFYRLLDTAPIVLTQASSVCFINPSDHDIEITCDMMIRFGKES